MYRWLRLTGSGKSTLIKFIISALDVDPEEEVCYVAFTGKAATVLQQKGCPNATTAHKLLYKAKMMANGTFKFFPRDNSELAQYKVIVVDEVSMLPKKLWDLMLTHGIYIIAAGDPGQLPPVDPNENNHVLDKPHIFLDEIMRQAAESEIIRLTMDIRAGKTLVNSRGNQVHVCGKNELVDGMYEWADQVLVATNDTRHMINDQMREMRGFGPQPTDGDKVICLRNYWGVISGEDQSGDPLVNGTIGTLINPRKDVIYVPYYAYQPGKIDVLTGGFISDTGEDYGDLNMDPKIILGGESDLEWRDKYKLGKFADKIGDVIPREFAYGYAITCHKAQGSEWDKVLVVEENFPRVREEHARWLYTAATRAIDKLVIRRNV